VSELGDWLRLDARAAKPLFDQLRTQVIDGVRDGRLPPGTRLPTVRDMAGQLETAGIVETRGRFGTFVARADPADAAMAAAANSYAETARALGLTKPQALRYLDAAFE